MKIHHYILVIILFCMKAHLNAQKVEFRFDFTKDLPNLSKMEGMGNINNFGFQTSYFPIKKIPIGIIYNMNIGNYSTFSYSTINNLIHNPNNQHRDTFLTVKNNINRFYVGIKIADQHSNRKINPYFSAMTGMGIVNTKIKLFETYTSGDESETGTLIDENLSLNYGNIYKFEIGLEYTLINRKRRYEKDCCGGYFSIFSAIGFVGSYNNFKYYNIQNSINDLDVVHQINLYSTYSNFRGSFNRNIESYYDEKMHLWYSSFGIILRF